MQVAAVQIQRAGGGGPVAVMGGQGLLDELALEQIGGGAQAQIRDGRGWADHVGGQGRREEERLPGGLGGLEGGEDLGILDSFLETGSNDVMVVIGINKSRNLIPFINRDVVKTVDMEGKVIIVDWDEIE